MRYPRAAAGLSAWNYSCVDATEDRPMPILLHGTTLHRAKSIKTNGPDPQFVEPGGVRAESFSTYLEQGPFILGAPDEYACRKAAANLVKAALLCCRLTCPRRSSRWRSMSGSH
jgi:hypothetical protein